MQNVGTLYCIHVSIIHTRKLYFHIQKQNSYGELVAHDSRATRMIKSPEPKKTAIAQNSQF